VALVVLRRMGCSTARARCAGGGLRGAVRHQHHL